MGILTDILLGRPRPNYLGGAGTSGVLSPWAGPSHLEQLGTAELLGFEPGRHAPLTRIEALQIPAVAKGRNLIIAALAGLPLKSFGANSSDPLPEQPTWIYRSDSDRDEAQPYNRMTATIDDLLFYGHSLWLTERSTATGLITEAAWLPVDAYEIRDAQVFPKGSDKPLNASQYILFHTPLMPGLLTTGAVTLRGARDTERAWTARMENPVPIVEYRITGDDTDDSANAKYAAQWLERHRSGEPSFGITPKGAELHTHGSTGEADLFLENRNAVRLDVAAFWNIPSALMDSSVAASSLTYVTNEGSRNRFFDECIPLWSGPIEAALSADKAVPRGQRIRFDKTELYSTPTPTGAPVAD